MIRDTSPLCRPPDSKVTLCLEQLGRVRAELLGGAADDVGVDDRHVVLVLVQLGERLVKLTGRRLKQD